MLPSTPTLNQEFLEDHRRFVWDGSVWNLKEQGPTESKGVIGEIDIFMVTEVPVNWLPCNGITFTQAEYPELFRLIGRGVTPNFDGYFVRGRFALPNTTEGYLTGRNTGITFPRSSVTTNAGNASHKHTVSSSVVTGWKEDTRAAYLSTSSGGNGISNYWRRTRTAGNHSHHAGSAGSFKVIGWDGDPTRPGSIQVRFYIRARISR